MSQIKCQGCSRHHATETVLNLENPTKRVYVCSNCFETITGPRPWGEPKKWVDTSYHDSLSWQLRRYTDFVCVCGNLAANLAEVNPPAFAYFMLVTNRFRDKIVNKKYRR